MINGDSRITHEAQQDKLSSLIEGLTDEPGALLPILHSIQLLFGYVPDSAVPLVAKKLNLSRADVHGVVSFYHHFRQTRPGRHVIQICRAESCQAMGSVALEQHVKQVLAIDYHETTENGKYSLEPVYCLGNCACSPSIAIADEVYGEMDADKFDQLISSLRFVTSKAGAL